MKLLFVCRGNPFAAPAGTEIFAGNLALELDRKGHEVHLIYEGKNSEKDLHLNKKHLKTHKLHLISIPYIRVLDFRRKCSAMVNSLMEKAEIDAIISFGSGTFGGHLFKEIKNLAKRPLLVYYAIDSMVAEYERSKPAFLRRGMIRLLEAWVQYREVIRSDNLSCRVADLVVASCKDTAQRMIKDYFLMPRKVKIVYFGIPDNFADGFKIHDTEVPTFLHVSTNPERKGTFYFLQALKILQDKYGVRVRGVIAGLEDSFYTNLAKTLDVNAFFLGEIPNDELKQYYAMCTALVSPSLSEGFCLPVIEAAMFRKPVIASKVGSLPDLVADGVNGFLTRPRDATLLAKRMYSLVTNELLRKCMSESAREAAEKFKISVVADEFVKVLQQHKDYT